MGITELKSNTHQKKKDWWDTISAKEKAAIKEGLKDIKKGNVFSHDKVMQEIRAVFPIK